MEDEVCGSILTVPKARFTHNMFDTMQLPTESVQSYQKCYCGAQNCYGRLFMYTGGTEA